MARDHYLPASYLGRFSAEHRLGARSRNNLVWVGHLGTNEPQLQKAESVGYGKGLYDLHPESEARPVPDSIDSWKYEQELPRVMDKLCSGERLSLADWLHVAVPFVAGQFVRGPEYNMRYRERMASVDIAHGESDIDKGWKQNQINFARVVEMQSYLVPVMAARWKVIHAIGGYELVLSDMGMVPIYDSAERCSGWAIPLDPHNALFLLPRTRKCFGTFDRDGQWYAVIEHLNEPDDFFAGFNEKAASTARRFIVGSNRTSVSKLLPLLSAKTERQLHVYRDIGWDIKRGIAAAGDDCIMWGAAACMADNNIHPDVLESYKPSIDGVNNERWTPFLLILQEYNSMGNGMISSAGPNLFIEPIN